MDPTRRGGRASSAADDASQLPVWVEGRVGDAGTGVTQVIDTG